MVGSQINYNQSIVKNFSSKPYYINWLNILDYITIDFWYIVFVNL